MIDQWQMILDLRAQLANTQSVLAAQQSAASKERRLLEQTLSQLADAQKERDFHQEQFKAKSLRNGENCLERDSLRAKLDCARESFELLAMASHRNFRNMDTDYHNKLALDALAKLNAPETPDSSPRPDTDATSLIKAVSKLRPRIDSNGEFYKPSDVTPLVKSAIALAEKERAE